MKIKLFLNDKEGFLWFNIITSCIIFKFFLKIFFDVDHFQSLLTLLRYCFCSWLFYFWLWACEILLPPQLGWNLCTHHHHINPAPAPHPPIGRRSFNHWTTREVCRFIWKEVFKKKKNYVSLKACVATTYL